MHIKITMRWARVRMVITKSSSQPLARMQKQRNPYTILMWTEIRKIIWRFLKKIKLPCEPTVPCLCICLNKTKLICWSNTHASVFIATPPNSEDMEQRRCGTTQWSIEHLQPKETLLWHWTNLEESAMYRKTSITWLAQMRCRIQNSWAQTRMRWPQGGDWGDSPQRIQNSS